MGNLLTRIGNAFHALGGSGVEKTMSPAVAAFVTGSDVDDSASGSGAKMSSPYTQSSFVYVAINRKARAISSLPFRISRLDSVRAKKVRTYRQSGDPRYRSAVKRALGENIIESGDVVDLFERPHPSMNRQLFWETVVTYNDLRGEFFVLPLDGMDSPVDLSTSAPRVQRLLTLPTELFWHVVVGYDLTGWRYTGSPLLTPIPSEFLNPSEVIHSRTPNPYLYWRGLSPLLLAMGPAGADFAASKYNQGYWLNNADTGLIVTTEQQATPDQQKAILAALRERKRKAGTPDRPLFLWGGAKIEKPALSGMEQNFIENRNMNRQEIGAIFEVPDSVMGFSDAKASSLSGGGNAITAERISWIETTIQPLCEHIEAAVAPIVRSFGDGLIGWFDVDSLPVMQEARRSRIDAATKAWAIGFNRNEVNEVYDLGFPKDKSGDKRYLPFNLQEIGADGALPGEDDPTLPPKTGDEQKGNPFTRLEKLLVVVDTKFIDDTRSAELLARSKKAEQLWKSHIATRNKSVNLLKGKVSKVLLDFRAIALRKMGEITLGENGKTWTVKDTEVEQRSLIDLIFSPDDFGHRLLEELSNPLLSIFETAGNEMLRELRIDDPWTMPWQAAQTALANRTQAIQGTGETVRKVINTTLNDGIGKGETMAELTARVKTVFNELQKFEAERIARTETNIIYNTARQQSMKSVGVLFKAWLSSHGPKVRPTHAAAELMYSVDSPIPIDQPFRVGADELMFPGDDSLGAGPGNIINCQCIQLAVKKKAEKTFEVVGLGELTFEENSAVTCRCHEEEAA